MSSPSPRPLRSAVRETIDLYRVYRPAWVIVYTSADVLADLLCQDHFEAHYAGRVRDEDWRISQANTLSRLWLRLPTMWGEFKDLELAQDAASWLTERLIDVEIVARNSKRDFTIRSYGVKKLGPS